MIFRGRVWKFGHDINTDEIIPARYLNLSDPKKLAEHVMEDADRDFCGKIAEGDIIVAGRNFGCGSSREHAPVAIKASGISCVVAESFARIFFRNSFNMGLPIFECPSGLDDINQGAILEVDTFSGIIFDLTNQKTFTVSSIPSFMTQLLEDGGLISHIRKTLVL
jgi:3-isopropylmalate/(R)-2-methylmalate dehydratase small subunit